VKVDLPVRLVLQELLDHLDLQVRLDLQELLERQGWMVIWLYGDIQVEQM